MKKEIIIGVFINSILITSSFRSHGNNNDKGVYISSNSELTIYKNDGSIYLMEDQIKGMMQNKSNITIIPDESLLKKLPGSASDKCQSFLNDLANKYNLDLKQNTTHQSKKYSYLTYQQRYHNIEVLWAEIKMQIDIQTEKLLRIDINRVSQINIETTPSIKPNKAVLIACESIEGAITNAEEIIPILKIMPAIRETQARLVYEIIVKGQDEFNIPFIYYTLVNAHDKGQILYRSNLIRNISDKNEIQLNADIYNGNMYVGKENINVSNTTIKTKSGIYISDDAGKVDLTGQVGDTASISLEGPWIKVKSKLLGNGKTPSFETIISGDEISAIKLNDHLDINHLSGFSNLNKIHNFIKDYAPDFDGIDTRVLMWVDYTAKSCGAFFNPDNISVNFHAEGSNGEGIMKNVNCNNMSGIASAVVHEYGHVFNYLYHKSNSKPNGLMNSHLHEGYADILAMFLTKNPVISEGVSADNPSFYYRRYDEEPKIMPDDWFYQDIYSGGQIIAGVWWDLYKYLDANITIPLFFEMLAHKDDGPNGTEPELFEQILLSTIYADDDDNNLSNGTPNDDAIIIAFSQHGITSKTLIDMLPAYTNIKENSTTNKYIIYPSFGRDGAFKVILPNNTSEPKFSIFDITGREITFETTKQTSNEFNITLTPNQEQANTYLIKINHTNINPTILKYMMIH